MADLLVNKTNAMKNKELTLENNKRKHPERFRAQEVIRTGKYYRDQNGSIRKSRRPTPPFVDKRLLQDRPKLPYEVTYKVVE